MQICRVTIGKGFCSSRIKWKAGFFLLIHCCEISHLSLLGLTGKNVFYCTFKGSCPCLWPDETSIYEPYLTRCSLAALGNNVSSWTEMKLFQSTVLMLRASHRGINAFLDLCTIPSIYYFSCIHFPKGISHFWIILSFSPPHRRYNWPSYPTSW